MWRLVFGERFRRKIVTIKKRFGGVKPPPYSTNGQGGVGANRVRPCSSAAIQDPTGEQCSPPTATVWLRSHHWLPLRGAPPLGGEGWARELEPPPSHPSVTFGDSSPQGEPRGVKDAAPYMQPHGSRRGEHCSPAKILRRRPTPRANTVRPYTPLPIGPVGRGLDPSKAPYNNRSLICSLLI